MANDFEKRLLESLVEARKELDKAKKIKAKWEARVNDLSDQLQQHLQMRGADATASYNGIGKASIGEPKVQANVNKGDLEALYQFLKDQGLGAVIKPKVHHTTLSGIVANLIKEKKPVPDFINYFFKPQVRITSSKSKEEVI